MLQKAPPVKRTHTTHSQHAILDQIPSPLFVNLVAAAGIFSWFIYLILYANLSSFWGDEICGIWASSHKFPSINMLKAVKSIIAAPPGEYLTLALFERLFHGLAINVGISDEAFFRIPYALAMGAGAMLLLQALFIAGVRKWIAFASVFFVFVLSRPLQYYAIEVRFYAWLVFFTCLTHFFFVKALAQSSDESPRSYRTLYVWLLSVLTGMFFHPFVTLSGVAQAGVLFLKGDKPVRIRAAAGMAVALLVFKAWGMIGMNVSLGLPPLRTLIRKEPYTAFWEAMKYWIPEHIGVTWLVAGLVVLVVTGIRRTRRWPVCMATLITILLSIMVPAVTIGFGHHFEYRHVILLVPLFALTLAYAADEVFNLVSRLGHRFTKGMILPPVAGASMLGVITIFWGYSFFVSYVPVPKRHDTTWMTIRRMLNGKIPEVVFGLHVPWDVSLSEIHDRSGNAMWIGTTWQYYLLGYDHMTLMIYSEEKKLSLLKEVKKCVEPVTVEDQKKIRVDLCGQWSVNGVSISGLVE